MNAASVGTSAAAPLASSDRVHDHLILSQLNIPARAWFSIVGASIQTVVRKCDVAMIDCDIVRGA
jgi:hypothetical protein